MAKTHVIKKDFDEAYLIGTSGHTWIFSKLSEIVSPTYGISTDAGVINTRISIAGRVETTNGASYAAIRADGINFRLTIEKGGEVAASLHSVMATGENAMIVNAGLSNNILVQGDHSTVVNRGRITDNLCGIYVDTVDEWKITNEKSGKIVVPPNEAAAMPPGVRINSAADETGELTNFGLIRTYSIEGNAGSETVTNKGRIEATVMLNGGADVVDNRGGTIIGEIRGGAGDDTLIAGRASDKLTEVLNEGTDTVKASFNYQLGAFVERLVLTGKRDINGTGSDTATINHIHGNTGDNKLSGLGGIDELSGGKGRDTLTGGADIDVFELAKGSGRDVVTDYTDEQDLIAVNGFAGIADFNALLPKIAQKNGFVEINMGKGDTLILKGALAGDLEQGDFIFNYEIA